MHSLLLLNGGVGKRVKAASPKQFIDINGLPILVYSLIAADACSRIDQIVLNYPEGYLDDVKDIVKRWAIKTEVVYVEAGQTRHQSVNNLLKSAKNDLVIIHEAARPFVRKIDFDKLIDCQYQNVSFMLPISFTVAPVDPSKNLVTGYLERDTLRNVQLPQRFAKKDLLDAHMNASKDQKDFTEDATLVATYGKEVHYIEGSDQNFKITTPLDVHLATMIVEDFTKEG